MRTSLKKLRGLAIAARHGYAGDRKDRRLQQSLAQLDELARASVDMQEMKEFYDSLLSAAAATTNSAYEFSESLREMGTCLLEKTALHDDEESGKVLLMLGKVQFELQKLVDNYRSHIVKTITSPSESLINQLQTLEDMKRQCDEKRSIYEYTVSRYREKGSLRSGKAENFSYQQLQAARNAYDEEANFFVFRLKSLRVGQSRSLLTQASRHHAAQLCFFRKALKSLEAIEPHVKLIAEHQHIDYQFSELEDDDGDDGHNNDVEDSNDDDYVDDGVSINVQNDRELSFDYGQQDAKQNAISTPRMSMEVDHVDPTFLQSFKTDTAKENLDKNRREVSFAFARELKTNSQSAPLCAEKQFDPAQRFIQSLKSSSRKFHSYVLPTPDETKNSFSREPGAQVYRTKRTNLGGDAHEYWHSSPLEQQGYEKILGNERPSGPITLTTTSVIREDNNHSTLLPLYLAEKLSARHLQQLDFDDKKVKRQAFSGPLNKSSNQVSSVGSPILLRGTPQLFSGPILRSPMPRPSSSPKLSPTASPTFVSPPKISELHELPRPPANLAERPSNQIDHSEPLLFKGQEIPAVNNSASSKAASPLPTPPQSLPRSFSIPCTGQRVTVSPPSTPAAASQPTNMAEDVASPPRTPVSASNLQAASTT